MGVGGRPTAARCQMYDTNEFSQILNLQLQSSGGATAVTSQGKKYMNTRVQRETRLLRGPNFNFKKKLEAVSVLPQWC